MDDSSDSKLKITPFGEALSIHQTSIYNMQKAIIPIGLRLLLFFSAMTESIFYPNAATCLQRADFKLAALFWWITLVFANLSNIFCTTG